jgi:hypothetical protein
LDEATESIGYPFKCKLTQSWANRATGTQWHMGHNHPCSFISGSFYLTTSEGETWFSVEDLWKPKHMYTTPEIEVTYKCPAVAGKLVLFPGCMYHSVGSTNTTEDHPRFTIAFNAFPEGPVGEFAMFANIAINPVTEKDDQVFKKKYQSQGRVYKKFDA